uniref:Zinc finger protein 14-like n=1 Tax=Mastacembelus armatus TaxID=205130 RepID=A0A7N8XR42_9TELE
MLWHKWLRAFEHYVEALGENELVDSTKRALLQNCLGLEGQHVFTTLIQGETTYAAAISVLTDYFASDPNTQMYRLKFHQRGQMPGETVDQFVSALEELLRPCNYGNLQDKLILDHLIDKTNCPQLKEKLLLKRETVTLATALVIGKEVESTLDESELFDFHERTHMSQVLSCPDCPKNFTNTDSFFCHLTSHSKYHATQTEEQSLQETDEVENQDLNKSSKKDEESDDCNEIVAEDNADSGNDNCQDKGPDVDVKTKDTDGTKIKGHFCPICVGRGFRGPNKLARHMRTHTKEKPFTCPICALTFSQSYHMTRHLRNQHKNNGTCPKCNETFNSPEELESHMGVHEKSYTCSTCGKKFKVEYALKKHEQGHQDEQYYCSLCRKHFSKLSHYKRHVMVHNRRESRCPHCDSVFLQLTALKYHLRTHIEERPYQLCFGISILPTITIFLFMLPFLINFCLCISIIKCFVTVFRKDP